MVTRCKVCGSKNITREIKKEGYDIKKGVIVYMVQFSQLPLGDVVAKKLENLKIDFAFA